MTEYKYRRSFWYHGIKIDKRADTEEELTLKIAKKISEIDRGILTAGGATPVNMWVERYFEMYVEDKVTDGVLNDRKYVYRKFIQPYIGTLKIRDVKASHCQTIVNNMAGYSKSRIDRACQLLYNIFKRARAQKLIPDNPAEDVIRPPAKDGHGRAATMKERALMLHVAKYQRGGLWLRCILYCGFRPGETENFRAEHINYDERLIYIDGTKSASAKRIVPAPAELIDDLQKLDLKPNELVFKNMHGYKLRKSSMSNMWQAFKREMNIVAGCKVYRNQLQPPYPIAEDLVPYCFRHTFATDLKDANIPYRIRQELLGHSDGSVTDNYTHKTEKSLNKARDMLEDFRLWQRMEIDEAIDDILDNGYNHNDSPEDLTAKFFPGIVK